MSNGFGRLFLFLLICLAGQFVITSVISNICLALGIHNFNLIVMLVDVGIGFFIAWLYRPAELRKGCLKDPNFYRDAGIFTLIWIGLDVFSGNIILWN
jgi:hypothetical protein